MKALEEQSSKAEDALFINVLELGNGYAVQAMSLFNALLINDALEAKRNCFNICRHGLEDTRGLLLTRGEGTVSFVELLKKILDFKKGFINTSSRAIIPKFARLDANRSGGTFGFNPSKKIFDPNVGFLQGRGNFVPPFSNGISLVFLELIFIMMNSSLIIVLNSLLKFKSG